MHLEDRTYFATYAAVKARRNQRVLDAIQALTVIVFFTVFQNEIELLGIGIWFI